MNSVVAWLLVHARAIHADCGDLAHPLGGSATVTQGAHLSTNAVDYGASLGTPIYASIEGEVTTAIETNADNTRPLTEEEAANGGIFCSGGWCCTPSSGGYGNQLVITAADGQRVRYAHLKQNGIVVNSGDKPCVGQLLGYTGASGYVCSSRGSTGEHLHFEYQDANGTWYYPDTCYDDTITYEECESESASLEILFPEEGEVLELGETYEIQWDSTGLPEGDRVCVRIWKGPRHDASSEPADRDEAINVGCWTDNDGQLENVQLNIGDFAAGSGFEEGNDYYVAINDEQGLAWDIGGYFSIACTGEDCEDEPVERGDGTLFVSNFVDDAISVIDVGTNVVVETLAVGEGPERLVATPDGSYVIVANTLDNTISIISVDQQQVVDTLAVDCGYPNSPALDGTGTYLFLSCSDDGTTVIYAWETGEYIDSASVSSSRGIYLFEEHSSDELFLLTGSQVKTADIDDLDVMLSSDAISDSSFQEVAYDSTRGRLLVTNSFQHAIHVFDASSLELEETWDNWSPWAYGVAYDESRDVVYVDNMETTIFKLDADSGEELDTVEVEQAPQALLLDEQEDTLWVINSQHDSVSRVNLDTFSVETTIPVGDEPTGLVLVE